MFQFLARLFISISIASSAMAQDFTTDSVASDLLNSPQGRVFELIQQGFPSDFDKLVTDLTTLYNDPNIPNIQKQQNGFDLVSNTTRKIRIENAENIMYASIDTVIKIQQLNRDTFAQFIDNPDLCKRYAESGFSSFRPEEMTPESVRLGTENSTIVFELIVEGRNKAKRLAEADQQDWSEVMAAWEARPQVNDDYKDSFYNNNVANPSYCAAQFDFIDFLIADRTDAKDRVNASVVGFLTRTN